MPRRKGERSRPYANRYVLSTLGVLVGPGPFHLIGSMNLELSDQEYALDLIPNPIFKARVDRILRHS
jgi:hypothetical protein